jgi:hypothetical protein
LGVYFRGEAGRPHQAFERLYAVGPEVPVEIRSVRDLGNLRLPIRTPADARSFVLFLTDPTVYYLFLPAVGVTLTCTASAGRPALGTVTEGLFDRISAFLPEVCEPTSGVFVVTRCLLIPSLVLRGEEWGYPVLSVEEVVDRSGRYSVRTARILGLAHRDELTARPAIDWGWWEFGRGLADRLVAEPHGDHLKLLEE